MVSFVELALKELLAHAGKPTPRITSVTPKPSLPRPRDFRRARTRKNDDAMRRPFGWLRLVFSEPIAGPFALGYGSHFGLGQFSGMDGGE